MESLARSIRRIHAPRSIGGSTRSRNSALRWKNRASNPVLAVANTPCRERACAAPCRSPTQTSICEQTSRRSFYLAVRSRAPMQSLTLDSCFIPTLIAIYYTSAAPVFLARRRERARRSRISRPATRTTAPKVSAEAATICSGFPCSSEVSWQTSIHSCRSARLSRSVRVCSFRLRCSATLSQNGGGASSR